MPITLHSVGGVRHGGALTDCVLWCGFVAKLVYQWRVCRIGSRQIDLLAGILAWTRYVSFESYIKDSRVFPANRFALAISSVQLPQLFYVGTTVLTKNRDNVLMLAKAATRKGYSVTPVWPSSRLMSSWGFVDSASEKSTILGWFAYIRRWRGVDSPLPVT